MAQRLPAINQLRSKIISQGVTDMEEVAKRMAKNTTYSADEIYGMLRMFVRETLEALRAGETVKIDGLVHLSANMKVGGAVNMSLRADRGAVAGLNNPLLWHAGKVTNHQNITKTSAELIELWNTEHPDDPVQPDS